MTKLDINATTIKARTFHDDNGEPTHVILSGKDANGIDFSVKVPHHIAIDGLDSLVEEQVDARFNDANEGFIYGLARVNEAFEKLVLAKKQHIADLRQSLGLYNRKVRAPSEEAPSEEEPQTAQ